MTIVHCPAAVPSMSLQAVCGAHNAIQWYSPNQWKYNETLTYSSVAPHQNPSTAPGTLPHNKGCSADCFGCWDRSEWDWFCEWHTTAAAVRWWIRQSQTVIAWGQWLDCEVPPQEVMQVNLPHLVPICTDWVIIWSINMYMHCLSGAITVGQAQQGPKAGFSVETHIGVFHCLQK